MKTTPAMWQNGSTSLLLIAFPIMFPPPLVNDNLPLSLPQPQVCTHAQYVELVYTLPSSAPVACTAEERITPTKIVFIPTPIATYILSAWYPKFTSMVEPLRDLALITNFMSKMTHSKMGVHTMTPIGKLRTIVIDKWNYQS